MRSPASSSLSFLGAFSNSYDDATAISNLVWEENASLDTYQYFNDTITIGIDLAEDLLSLSQNIRRSPKSCCGRVAIVHMEHDKLFLVEDTIAGNVVDAKVGIDVQIKWIADEMVFL